MLEALPNPEPHPEYRWHTHEQCMFSIVAALTRNDYARRLWFCWTWEPESVASYPGRASQTRQPPTRGSMRPAPTRAPSPHARGCRPMRAGGATASPSSARASPRTALSRRGTASCCRGCAGPPGRRASADAAYGGPADQPHRKKSEGGLEASESTLQRGIRLMHAVYILLSIYELTHRTQNTHQVSFC